MAFQVSPGVQVKEIDLTNVVPAVASTSGAFAGYFRWGPVDEVVTVSSQKDLVDEFYPPEDNAAQAEDFYSAEGFLRYGSSLRVVRVNSTNLANANVSGTGSQLIKNDEEYVESYRDGSNSGNVGAYFAKYAGALGNSLSINVCASADAYSESDVGSTAASNALGATSIGTVADAQTKFVVGDRITFTGHSQVYKVTAVAASSLTIEAIGQPDGTGLVQAVDGSVNAVNISREWEHAGLFDKAPGTSTLADANGSSNDEIHIVVIDEDGDISGTKNTVLESFGFVSLCSDAKDLNGDSNYYRDVLQRDSEWVYWASHDSSILAATTTHYTTSSLGSLNLLPVIPQIDSFSQGSNGRIPTAAQKYGAWQDHFEDAENSDISFLIVGSTRTDNGSGTEQDTLADWTSIINQGILVCEKRKDCLLVASPRRASVVNRTSESDQVTDVKADVNSASSSSFVVFDSGWLYIFDRYNNRYHYVPANGHTAGIMARSDLLQDPWYSPAGFSRGQYLGITKLAFNPKKASRDDLYRARINPIVTFPGQGTVLFGDKTGLSSPSAFDRINVRRLFIVLEKAISTAAKSQLFEFNDAFTRAQFRAAIEPFLRDVKNRRGIFDFSVVCDESNNTDSVIDRNEFVASIFIKPARSINFITLNFVAARSGVEFEELYGAV